MMRRFTPFILVASIVCVAIYALWSGDIAQPTMGKALPPSSVIRDARLSALTRTAHNGPQERIGQSPLARADGKRHHYASADVDQSDPTLRPPPGRYLDSVASLRERARNGDSAAGYVLAMALADCYLAEKGRPVLGGNGDAARCDGLNVEQSGEAIALLQAAADQGLPAAQILYSALTSELLTPTDMIRDPSMVQDYKERSMRYLSALAEQGSGMAMTQLADAYGKGIMTAQDLPLAYAYWYAGGMLPGSGPVDDPRLIFGGGLTDSQIESAKALAAKIYQRCCQ